MEWQQREREREWQQRESEWQQREREWHERKGVEGVKGDRVKEEEQRHQLGLQDQVLH